MTNNIQCGLIWTNHALDRIHERRMSQDLAIQTFHNPDSVTTGKEGSEQFKKKFDGFTITVVAKKNERQEWVVVSCWMDPPVYGTADYKKKQNYKRFQKASFWGKVFLTLKNQLGF